MDENQLKQDVLNMMAKSSETEPIELATRPETPAFLRPQTPEVNLDFNPKADVSNFVNLAKTVFGERGLPISSGRRDAAKTQQILEDRLKREGLDQYGSQQDLIRKILLRGESPDNIEYPTGGWYPKAESQMREVAPENWQDILRKIGSVRKDFSGYESPHLQGQKLDISLGALIDEYGLEEGTQKFNQLRQLLEQNQYKTLYEPDAGRSGVLDVMLKSRGE